MRYVIESRPKGEWCVREYNDQDEMTREVPAAVSVTEACRILKKSRRQLYRYMKEGWVKPVGKFLNEWLVNKDSVTQLQMLNVITKNRIPKNIQYLFHEYHANQLRLVSSAVTIAGRIMDEGGIQESRWLLKTYPRNWLKVFLNQHGRRLLSPWRLKSWCTKLGNEIPPPTWREAGREIYYGKAAILKWTPVINRNKTDMDRRSAKPR